MEIKQQIMFLLKNQVDRHTQTGASPICTCFVDFKGAFDAIWHDGLFYNLRCIGVSD